MSQIGYGLNCYALRAVNSGTTPLVSRVTDPNSDVRALSYQLCTGADLPVYFAVTGTDAVVASTHTWTFANGGFTASNVGGTIVISGSVHNDGTYTIATVTNATTIVTGGSQTNETFTTAVKATSTNDSLAGSWKIEISNDYAGNAGYAGQPPTNGAEHWSDITALSTTALVAVVPATATTKNQLFLKVGLAFRFIRATFTPTSGIGTAYAIIAGGNS